MFDTILIANRGEIACRVIRTCRRLGVRTVAVFSEADRGALFTRLADEAFEIGAAPARESYLKVERILAVAKRAGAQAVHPGYGFLAENAAFARACRDAGVRFIGPSPEAIAAMGLKDAAKALMERAGVNVVPGYHGEDQSDGTLRVEAERIGFPILVKAVAGGGGKGMRRVDAAAELMPALTAARREAESAFGDARLLLEKYLVKPRHIEVQVLADAHGNTLHLNERDCSLQRRHQKLVEEAPAPHVTAALRQTLGAMAVRAAEAVRYEGAGTVELIADVRSGLDAERIYFMEMNTRLQVEHPVTELITGLDLVEWQLRVASGEALPWQQSDVALRGHALEVRVCAEEPEADFAPKVGKLLHVGWPAESAHLRVETGVTSGDEVSVHYDSMIAKLVVWGEDRETAVRHMQRALSQVELLGLETNVPFLAAAISHPAFRSGDVHTGFLADHREQLLADARPDWAQLVSAAAMSWLCARAEPVADPYDRFSPWHDTRSFRINTARLDLLRLRVGGRDVDVHVMFEDDQTRLSFDGVEVHVPRATLHDDRLRMLADGVQRDVGFVRRDGRSFVVFGVRSAEVAARSAGADVEEDKAALGALRSPLPGRILNVFVTRGQLVSKGDPLVSLEAMKMEHTLRANVAGVVSELTVEAQEQVVEGSTLLVLSEPTAKE